MGDDSPSPFSQNVPQSDFEEFFQSKLADSTIARNSVKRGNSNQNVQAPLAKNNKPNSVDNSSLLRHSVSLNELNNSVPIFINNLKSKMAASGDNDKTENTSNSHSAISKFTDNSNMESQTAYNPPKLNLYPLDHEGEFLVLVDSSKGNPEDEKIRNSLFLYRKIRNFKVSGIRLITPIGRTLYRIKFDSASSANAFVCKDFSQVGLKPFIPDTFIYSFGVIHGIPLDLSEDYIRESATSEIEIASVKRFTRKDKETDKETPTLSVKIGFRSGNIPEHIVLDFSYIKVNIYYPPLRQCHNCGRLGHTVKGCRSKKRCLNCSKQVCDGNCIKKCILCGDSTHSSTDKKLCPKWREEDDILKIMTIKRLSRTEVIKSYSTNRFDIFNEYDNNFPALPLAKSKPVKDRDHEVNKILTGARKYNRLLYQKPPPPKPAPHFVPLQPHNTDPLEPSLNRVNNVKVSELEKVFSEFFSFMGNVFSKDGAGSHLRVLNDFNKKISNVISDIRAPPDDISISSIEL